MSNNNYRATYGADLILEIDSKGDIVSINLLSEVNSFDRCKKLTQGKYRSVEDQNKVFDMLTGKYGYIKVEVEVISGDSKVTVRDPVEWNKKDFGDLVQKLDEAMTIDGLVSNTPSDYPDRLLPVYLHKPLSNEPIGLTHEQLNVACKNIGINLACKGCAQLFYTGVNDEYFHDENCTRNKEEIDTKFTGYQPKPTLTCPVCKKLSYLSPIDAFGIEVKCSNCGEVSSQKD